MQTFTLVDGIVAAVIVLSALLAYARGLTRELMAIVGWVVAALMALAFAGAAVPLVKQIPVLGDYIADSCELSIITSFALVFALVLVLASLFTPLLSSLVQRSALGPVDQALGFLFGALRGILLIAVAFFVYAVVLDARDIEMIENSRSAKVFGNMIANVEDENPSEALTWVTRQYEGLVSSCAAE